ncbi:hypothetical protein F0562_023631 [Nyssa sinensis]|uniref:Uncharacterized protein n=1 Tax=Nyssa sinensis TaxID=561372 RepID=A0A5J5BGE0_9ASTE|nr:hypothetical protein F0562_023631 [Nyssa sinensis]
MTEFLDQESEFRFRPYTRVWKGEVDLDLYQSQPLEYNLKEEVTSLAWGCILIPCRLPFKIENREGSMQYNPYRMMHQFGKEKEKRDQSGYGILLFLGQVSESPKVVGDAQPAEDVASSTDEVEEIPLVRKRATIDQEGTSLNQQGFAELELPKVCV